MDTPEISQKQSPVLTKAMLRDPDWRLCNLYWIKDKSGHTVKFCPNWAQKQFLSAMCGRNIILKARQLGFSTLIDLLLLDSALFHSGFRAGIVADTEDTAKELMQTKIKFAYEHLPTELQRAINLTVNSVTALEFTNGSCVHVGVTLRAGTYGAVHVSEFGKICVEHPDKAQEIVTGSLETVPKDGAVFIESTARGRWGTFWEWWKRAAEQTTFTDLDYRPHFFPWWRCPEYTLDSAGLVLTVALRTYFETLAAGGITLTPGQQAWYVVKQSQLQTNMLSEYPSTADEAFQASTIGAYWAAELAACRASGRVCDVPVDPAVPVNTYWDLGIGAGNAMAIWFGQTCGSEIHWVDFYEAEGAGFQHYAKVLSERGYTYGTHYAPHDIAVRELGTGKSRLEIAAGLGLNFTPVPRVADKSDSIEAARPLIARSWFDRVKCAVGVEHLESYRRGWSEEGRVWKPAPVHDSHSNAADACQVAAMVIALPAPQTILTPGAGVSRWASTEM